MISMQINLVVDQLLAVSELLIVGNVLVNGKLFSVSFLENWTFCTNEKWNLISLIQDIYVDLDYVSLLFWRQIWLKCSQSPKYSVTIVFSINLRFRISIQVQLQF